MTAAELRQSYLDFFREQQHTIVPSASLLPDSPNLLFTNAGMNQFVPIFLGQAKCPYQPGRAADTQKCIRAGGKHNDLEDVGLDTYHHTFFEMLGNWSFGDYFKREAIDWAWELVVRRWQFPAGRVYATYFGGDEKIAADTEARDLWLRYLPADQVVPGNRKDNFWMMGDTGPCGPCSELHIDLTPGGDGGAKLVNAGSPQCMEIWNLVFIQFNANPDGSLTPLPAKHVDTGMGFERVAGIMQCTKGLTDFSQPISNYGSDVFAPIFAELERLSGKKYGGTLPGSQAPGSQAGTLVPPAAGKVASKTGGASVPACAPRSGITSFRVTCRDLPHWQSPGSVYFVTFRAHQGQLLTDEQRDLVLQACRYGHGEKYHLYAVTVMPDHVHLLLWPRPVNPAVPAEGFVELSDILHGIKSYTANQLQRRHGWQGAVWQHESFDRIVRDEQEFAEKWEYIAHNAVKKQLAESVEGYRWFWYSPELLGAERKPTESAAQAGTLVPPSQGKGLSMPGGASVPACGETTGPACAVSPEQLASDIAFRVIADHIRCLSFAVADGIQPSNEGRGYVLRRILRRAVRYGRNLGFREPFFYKLVDVVAQNFGDVFPELRRNQAKVEQVLRGEEEGFNRTLDRGIEIFEETVAGVQGKTFPAAKAFKLYDTSGFPLDLTELMARERGLTVDVAGFEKLMDEQRQRAREDHAKKKTVITVASDDATAKPARFVGYEQLETAAVVVAVAEGNVILDQTPFYAEMGGQVGDTGEIGGWEVRDTQKQGDVYVHRVAGEKQPQAGTLVPPAIGQSVRAVVDAVRRANIQRHHTVTHIFHWALHEVVSREARQRGSLVAAERLRFDFNHPERLTEQQLADIERLVNERIRENAPVSWREVPYADVRGNPAVMQFFGDKYGEVVRVVQIGGQAGQLDGYSMELCGGTHTRATGEIGLFKITREAAVAAGIRRLEAVVGEYAQQFVAEQAAAGTAEAAKVKARELEKELAKQQQAVWQAQAPAIAEQVHAKAQSREGRALIVEEIPGATADLLRAVLDVLKPKLASGMVVLGGVSEGKVALLCYVTPDLVKDGKHAGKIVGELAKICGGGGGGRPDLAQAGGKQPEKLTAALASVQM